MHLPPEPVIIVDGVVLGTAIVPHGHRSDRPLKPAGELGSCLVTKKIRQYRFALFFSHPLEPHRVTVVDKQRLAPRFGMDSDHRMRGFQNVWLRG